MENQNFHVAEASIAREYTRHGISTLSDIHTVNISYQHHNSNNNNSNSSNKNSNNYNNSSSSNNNNNVLCCWFHLFLPLSALKVFLTPQHNNNIRL